MKLADRYILSELAGPFFLSAGGFILFMIANVIFLLVDQIATKHVPVIAVIEMLLLRIPAILVLTFPVSILFATLLGLGRLSSDHEIMAMRTSGITFARLSYPIVGLSLILVVVTFITNEFVSPWATHRSEMIVKQILMRQTIPPVEPNVFIHGPKNSTYYIGSIDKTNKTLNNIMVFEPSESGFPRMTVAARAKYDGAHLYLYDGSIHQYGASGLTSYESSFKEMVIPVLIDPEMYATSDRSPFEMNTSELRQQIQNLKRGGVPTQVLATDYHFKFSLPFGSLVAGLIAFPLGIRFPRGGKVGGTALAVFLLFVYYCLFSASRLLGTTGLLPPWMAAWLPNVVLGTTGLWLLTAGDKIG